MQWNDVVTRKWERKIIRWACVNEQVKKSFLDSWSTKKEETRGHYTAKFRKATWQSLFDIQLWYKDGIM